jgi:hypothetical protein
MQEFSSAAVQHRRVQSWAAQLDEWGS